MTVQLIHAPTDTHLWADSYDRDNNEVAALPEQAAQAIAKRLNATVATTKPARYVNPEAHDAYLRGRVLWIAGEYDKSGEYFQKAIELQPDYALARHPERLQLRLPPRRRALPLSHQENRPPASLVSCTSCCHWRYRLCEELAAALGLGSFRPWRREMDDLQHTRLLPTL
jgi:tetratricopeptide (TPR) repeat protein